LDEQKPKVEALEDQLKISQKKAIGIRWWNQTLEEAIRRIQNVTQPWYKR
jgi:hypothetical protein